MSAFSNWYARIAGGWRTHGPMSGKGDGAFGQVLGGNLLTSVGPVDALALSAYYACLRLRGETIGTLPLKVFDENNNEIADHDLQGLLRVRPNAYQTGPEFWSAMAANVDMFGNGIGLVDRYADGTPYNIDFIETDLISVTMDKVGRPVMRYDGERLDPNNVLHMRGFSLDGYWGIPTLTAGQTVLGMQKESNLAAASTFKSGLKSGGFFKPSDSMREQMTPEQEQLFYRKIAEFYKPENMGKWFMLPRGIGTEQNLMLKIDPVTAEVLASRGFGVEEICRFMGVPPPLIGHTSKASSWASSLLALNQHLVTYSLLPTTVRFERRIAHTLFKPRERGRLRVQFNMDGLLRGDILTRFKTYEIGRRTNVYSPNDVNRLEGRPTREGGDDYTVESSVNVEQNGADTDETQEAGTTDRNQDD